MFEIQVDRGFWLAALGFWRFFFLPGFPSRSADFFRIEVNRVDVEPSFSFLGYRRQWCKKRRDPHASSAQMQRKVKSHVRRPPLRWRRCNWTALAGARTTSYFSNPRATTTTTTATTATVESPLGLALERKLPRNRPSNAGRTQGAKKKPVKLGKGRWENPRKRGEKHRSRKSKAKCRPAQERNRKHVEL